MKLARWLIGLAVIVFLFIIIMSGKFSSLLEWQSLNLKRAFFIIMFCSSFCLWRMLMGPTSADRAVALDILGILILGFCAILGIATGRDWYIDIGIAWALQSFISILALGKYLEGRVFDE
jgi:multicomponent Na+:H+ antiporter subunit F